MAVGTVFVCLTDNAIVFWFVFVCVPLKKVYPKIFDATLAF